MVKVKHAVVVTGASRGFGEAVAVAFARSYLPRQATKFILVARSVHLMEGVRNVIMQHAPEGSVVDVLGLDLGNADTISTAVATILSGLEGLEVETATLVNNAGSLFDLSKTADQYTDFVSINNYIMFNLSSMVFLSSSFCRAAREARRCNIINVSSLLALEAFKGWGLYATCKAARDMYLKVLAKDADTNSVKVLNWAPGPMQTTMIDEVIDTLCDAPTAGYYSKMRDDGKLVEPAASALKLVEVINTDTYTSGDHLDYYDIFPPEKQD